MRSSSRLLLVLALSTPVVASAEVGPVPSLGPASSAGVAIAHPERKEPTPARRSVDSNTCATCHNTLPKPELRRPATEYAESVHADDRIGCVGCHQGDPRDPTVGAHDWKNGFKPRPEHADVAALCGGCHARAEFIRRFNANLRTDQAELFPLSLHGKLTAAGDQNAPTCTTCHGSHAVHPNASLSAPTHRRNVAKLCGRCHQDAQRMAPYGLPTNQVAKWERSAHARAVRAGSLSAPSCTGCHGPHSATPPRASSVGRVCGQCHEAQLDAFRKSPHSKAFHRLGLSECVPCHDPHEARRSSWVVDSRESACNRCHAQGSRPQEVASSLAQSVQAARERVRATRARLDTAATRGVLVAGADEALDAVVSREARLSVLVHSLDPARLRQPIAEVMSAADRAEQLVAAAERGRVLRRRGYSVALALALVLLGLLIAKSAQLARRRPRSP
jgi:predicted CXXCH cytochrome family protein